MLCSGTWLATTNMSMLGMHGELCMSVLPHVNIQIYYRQNMFISECLCARMTLCAKLFLFTLIICIVSGCQPSGEGTVLSPNIPGIHSRIIPFPIILRFFCRSLHTSVCLSLQLSLNYYSNFNTNCDMGLVVR